MLCSSAIAAIARNARQNTCLDCGDAAAPHAGARLRRRQEPRAAVGARAAPPALSPAPTLSTPSHGGVLCVGQRKAHAKADAKEYSWLEQMKAMGVQ